jgi:hypothetical protein
LAHTGYRRLGSHEFKPQSGKSRYRGLRLNRKKSWHHDPSPRSSPYKVAREEKEMEPALEDLQALRLLRAFWQIKDGKTREAIVAAAEQARDAEREACDQQPTPER